MLELLAENPNLIATCEIYLAYIVIKPNTFP